MSLSGICVFSFRAPIPRLRSFLSLRPRSCYASLPISAGLFIFSLFLVYHRIEIAQHTLPKRPNRLVPVGSIARLPALFLRIPILAAHRQRLSALHFFLSRCPHFRGRR